jgi:predicted metal-dependent peptidase
MITNALLSLVKSDRFYADLLMRLHRVYTTRLPTMAVSLERGGTLYINPTFWKENEGEGQVFLIHECLHLLFDHIGRSKSEGGMSALKNIAADLAINDIIRGFPNTATVGGKEAHLATVANYRQHYPTMEHKKSYEYYVEFLKQEGDGGSGKGGQTMDDHGEWEKGEMTADEAKAIVRDLVDKATSSTKNAGQQVPSELRPFIESLYESGISWEEVLRSVPEAAEVAYRESSRKRRDRRYGTDFPGERVVRRCDVVVGFDVSGSIGDEIVSKFDKVLMEIHEKANVKVLFFDHQIQKEIDYEPGCLNGGIPGGGGTLFKPVFERARELNADALIMLTDGMLADSIDRPGFLVVWGILDGYKSPVDWGRSVIVK